MQCSAVQCISRCGMRKLGASMPSSPAAGRPCWLAPPGCQQPGTGAADPVRPAPRCGHRRPSTLACPTQRLRCRIRNGASPCVRPPPLLLPQPQRDPRDAKYWWALRAVVLGFHAVFMDADVVVLGDLLAAFDDPQRYDVQGLSDSQRPALQADGTGARPRGTAADAAAAAASIASATFWSA